MLIIKSLKRKTLFLALGLAVILNLGIISPTLAEDNSITGKMKDILVGVNLPTVADSEGGNADTGVQNIIGSLINTILGLFGVFFLVLMIYGGYRWMNARGNDEEIGKAKDIIRSAIIGFVIVMLAYAISVFVTTALQDRIVNNG